MTTDVFRPNMYEPVRNEKVAVGVTSSVIAYRRNEENPRRMIMIRNTSDDVSKVITVHLGNEQAVAGVGVVLLKDEAFTDSSDQGYRCHQDMMTAIGAVADCQLSIVER